MVSWACGASRTILENNLKKILSLAMFCFATFANSQPIEMIAPFPVGGGTDIVARTVQQELSQDLKMPINLVNRPGGDGAVAGIEFLSNNHPNKILIVTTGTSLFAKLKRKGNGTFDPVNDFDIIGPVAATPWVITVSAQKFASWENFVQYAKSDVVNCGTSNASATFFIKAVAAKEKLNINAVPFRGSADVANNLVGKQIDCGVDVVAPYTELIKANMVKVIAAGTKYNDVPVLEFGTYKFYSFFSVALHKNMDPALKQRITELVLRFHSNPEFVKRMAERNFTVPKASTSFGKTLQQDYIFLENMRSNLGISLE